LAVAAVFPLRRRARQAGDGQDAPFRTPGYPVTPLLFIAATILLLGNALADPAARLPTAVVFAVILGGIPLFHVAERSFDKTRSIERRG